MMKRLVIVLLLVILLATGCSANSIDTENKPKYEIEGIKINSEYNDKIEINHALNLMQAYILGVSLYEQGIFTEQDIVDYENSVTRSADINGDSYEQISDFALSSYEEREQMRDAMGERGDTTLVAVSSDVGTHISEFVVMISSGVVDVLQYEEACIMDELGIQGRARYVDGRSVQSPDFYVEQYVNRREDLENWLDEAQQWLDFEE